MANELYNVVFNGKTLPGFELAQVKVELGHLFGVSGEKLDMMFSGKAITIKKSADRATADKYLQAMKKAGAAAMAKIVEGNGEDFSNTEEETTEVTPATSSEENMPKKTLHTSSASLTLGELGEQLVPPKSVEEASFNTEGLTIAPIGADVMDVKEPLPPTFDADVSDLSMAEAGERILDPNSPPAETRGTTFKVDEG